MLLAMAAMGGHYGRRPASSYGSCAAWSAGSLTKHRPASPSPICSPVSSRGGGDDDREPHGADDDASFVTPRMEEEQGRLPTRADFMKPSATPRNIRIQTPRLDRRVDGANQVPPRFIHKATPARLMRRVRSSHNFRQRVGAMDAINEWRCPKSVKGRTREAIKRNGRLRPCRLVYPQLVIGSLMVPLRVATIVIVHLAIQMVRTVQFQGQGWRDGSLPLG